MKILGIILVIVGGIMLFQQFTYAFHFIMIGFHMVARHLIEIFGILLILFGILLMKK